MKFNLKIWTLSRYWLLIFNEIKVNDSESWRMFLLHSGDLISEFVHNISNKITQAFIQVDFTSLISSFSIYSFVFVLKNIVTKCVLLLRLCRSGIHRTLERIANKEKYLKCTKGCFFISKVKQPIKFGISLQLVTSSETSANQFDMSSSDDKYAERSRFINETKINSDPKKFFVFVFVLVFVCLLCFVF